MGLRGLLEGRGSGPIAEAASRKPHIDKPPLAPDESGQEREFFIIWMNVCKLHMNALTYYNY